MVWVYVRLKTVSYLMVWFYVLQKIVVLSMAWVYMTENRKFFDGIGLCSPENRSSLMAGFTSDRKS